jgi:signal transduction histidine kinase
VSNQSVFGLIGPIVQAGAALMLMMVFVILLRFTKQRRFGAIWLAAWTAHLLASLPLAIVAINRLWGFHFSTPTWPARFALLMVGGQYAFLALLVIGGLNAAGAPFSKKAIMRITAIAFFAGILVALAGAPIWLRRVQLFAQPALVFGAAFVAVRASKGGRERGLVSIGMALTLYGFIACEYLLADFIAFSDSSLSPIVTALWRYSGYLDAVGLALMGAAVIVLMVHEAFVEAVHARGDQVRAEAVADRAAILSGVISDVVRDLGTPVNVVLQRSGALLESPANNGMTNSLIEIQRQAQTAHHRIEDLQGYVRELAEGK